MVDINEYTRETTCEYKGELYSVRDNGAVLRHARKGKMIRPLDNVWTFGTKNKSNGYMMLSNHRVHIIVAKAFIEGNADGNMIVDHIDTNRCNNRVENLRWLTRLENVLLNEVTLKRVTYLCGGDIQKFIDNPSCLQNLTGTHQDIMWMRTVTKEEAKLAWEHISAWAKRPMSTFKMMKQREKITNFEEWIEVHKPQDVQPSIFADVDATTPQIFEAIHNSIEDKYSNEIIKDDPRSIPHLNDTWAGIQREALMDGTLQRYFDEKMYFPLCPSTEVPVNLEEYAKKLNVGDIIACSEQGEVYPIKTIGWTLNFDAICVSVQHDWPNTLYVRIENGKYLHSLGRYSDTYQFCDSPNVLQCGANTQFSFPLCPKDGNITLEEYANLLQEGVCFHKNMYSDGFVIDKEITVSEDGQPILYIGVSLPTCDLKHCGEIIVFIEHGKVIHQIGSRFFDETYLDRQFCMIRGQEWDDRIAVFDDYC